MWNISTRWKECKSALLHFKKKKIFNHVCVYAPASLMNTSWTFSFHGWYIPPPPRGNPDLLACLRGQLAVNSLLCFYIYNHSELKAFPENNTEVFLNSTWSSQLNHKWLNGKTRPCGSYWGNDHHPRDLSYSLEAAHDLIMLLKWETCCRI